MIVLMLVYSSSYLSAKVRFFAGIFPKLLGFVLKKLFTNAPTVLQKQKGVLAIIAHRAACQIPGAASPLFCSGLSVSLP